MVYFLAICVTSTILVLYGIRKLREKQWGYCQNKINLTNKIAIVTGANSGIGYEIAKELAKRNAKVILACRTLESAEFTKRKLQKELLKAVNLDAVQLDLVSLEAINTFAMYIKDHYSEINLLINNAGVSYPKNERHETQDGFEIHFGVNYLGHYYLTNLLLEKMSTSQPSRIIIISSSLHERGQINLDNLNSDNPRDITNLYANSKLANVYFCRELAKRTNVNVYAVCPGWIYTNLFRHSIRWHHYLFVPPIAFIFMRSARQGAQTAIYCATEPKLQNETGLLYKDCQIYESKYKFDDKESVKLWDRSNEFINKTLKK